MKPQISDATAIKKIRQNCALSGFSDLPRCHGKVSYPTKKAAQTQLNKSWSSHKRKGKRAQRIYCCDWCNRWHLTSKD